MKRLLFPLVILLSAPPLAMAANYLTLRAEGLSLLESGKNGEAESLFSRMAGEVRSPVQKADALQLASLALAREGNVEAALAKANEITDEPMALFGKMQVLSEARRWKELLELSRDTPFDAWPEKLIFPAYLLRGHAYQSTGDREAAAADYEAAARHTILPNNQARAWSALARAQETDDAGAEAALAAYGKAIAAKPSGGGLLQRAHEGRVLLLLKLGRHEEARAALAAMEPDLRKDPHWACTFLILTGQVHEALQENSAALDAYTRATRVADAPEALLSDAKARLQKLGETK